MPADVAPTAARHRRLAEELSEAGMAFDRGEDWQRVMLEEIDYALRPTVHERRVTSVGSIVDPTTDPSVWERGTDLSITRRPVGEVPIDGARIFADGLSSWLIRPLAGRAEWAVFDRPAGSERDLVVLAESLGATIVQRHPSNSVRIVGSFGVLRWDGLTWHHERPISAWLDSVSACHTDGDIDVLEQLLEFAVHDLGARGIGAILVYRPYDDGPPPPFEVRLPTPPPLQVTRPAELAPLRHALAQVDGAAVLDRTGTLRELGVRLVPSPDAESGVDGYRGMRHTSGRRYSYDDPSATIIVVSDDGPVTLLRNGRVVGSSAPPNG